MTLPVLERGIEGADEIQNHVNDRPGADCGIEHGLIDSAVRLFHTGNISG